MAYLQSQRIILPVGTASASFSRKDDGWTLVVAQVRQGKWWNILIAAPHGALFFWSIAVAKRSLLCSSLSTYAAQTKTITLRCYFQIYILKNYPAHPPSQKTDAGKKLTQG
eukprot:3274787-Amphidinium_carterae.1